MGKPQKEFDVYKWHKETFPEDSVDMIYERVTEVIAEKNKKRTDEHFKKTGVKRGYQIRSARLRQMQELKHHTQRGHEIIMQDLDGDKIFDIKVCKDCDEILMPINAS